MRQPLSTQPPPLHKTVGPFLEMFSSLPSGARHFTPATHPNTPPYPQRHPPQSHPEHQSQPFPGYPQPQSTAASSSASTAPPPPPETPASFLPGQCAYKEMQHNRVLIEESPRQD